MAKVLCMEVGTNTVRLAEVNKRGRIAEVSRIAVFDTPDDAIKDGKIRISDSVIGAIRDGIDASGIKATDVYFVVESTKILFKQVELPFVPKRQVQGMLELSFSDYFPVDETLYHISFVIGKVYEKNGQKMMGVDAFAIPNDLSESFYNLAVALGLNAKGLTATSRAVASLSPNKFVGRNVAMVNINEKTSTLSIIADGDMLFNKTISGGIDSAIQQVINSPLTMDSLSVCGATEQLYANNIIMRQMPNHLDEGASDQLKLQYNVTTSVVSLIKSIEATFTSFLAKENIPIQEFRLSGLGAGFAGITQLLASEFGIPVSVVQQEDYLRVLPACADETLLLGCYPCIGAAVDAANFFTAAERAGGDLARRKKIDRYFMIGGVLLLVTSVAFCSWSWLDSNIKLEERKMEKARLERKVAELTSLGVKVARDNYTTAVSYNEKVKELYKETTTGNEEMTIFLEELENTLPRSARVTSFDISPISAKVSFSCQDKFVAAGVLHLLRNLETIHTMECSSVSELESTHEVSFNCTFTLKNKADRDASAGIIVDENGNIIGGEVTDPEQPDSTDTPESTDQTETTPAEPEILYGEGTPINTKADLSEITYKEVTFDLDMINAEILRDNKFTPNNETIFIVDKSINAETKQFKTEGNVSFEIIEDPDGTMSLISSASREIIFYKGLHVGMTIEDVENTLGDEIGGQLSPQFIILKNDEHTMIIKLDALLKKIVERITVMENIVEEPSEPLVPEETTAVIPETTSDTSDAAETSDTSDTEPEPLPEPPVEE